MHSSLLLRGVLRESRAGARHVRDPRCYITRNHTNEVSCVWQHMPPTRLARVWPSTRCALQSPWHTPAPASGTPHAPLSCGHHHLVRRCSLSRSSLRCWRRRARSPMHASSHSRHHPHSQPSQVHISSAATPSRRSPRSGSEELARRVPWPPLLPCAGAACLRSHPPGWVSGKRPARVSRTHARGGRERWWLCVCVRAQGARTRAAVQHRPPTAATPAQPTPPPPHSPTTLWPQRRRRHRFSLYLAPPASREREAAVAPPCPSRPPQWPLIRPCPAWRGRPCGRGGRGTW